MAPLTSSFIADVEEAVLAEVLRLCGTGDDAWAEPDYLQIQTARRGKAILPGFDLDDDELPAFVMDYQVCEKNDGQVGAFMVTHRWLCGAMVRLTPDRCGYESTPTEPAFRQCVMASTNVLLNRMDEVLAVFSPSVSNAVFPEQSGRRWIPWSQVYLERIDELAYNGYCLVEYNLTAHRQRRST